MNKLPLNDINIKNQENKIDFSIYTELYKEILKSGDPLKISKIKDLLDEDLLNKKRKWEYSPIKSDNRKDSNKSVPVIENNISTKSKRNNRKLNKTKIDENQRFSQFNKNTTIKYVTLGIIAPDKKITISPVSKTYFI